MNGVIIEIFAVKAYTYFLFFAVIQFCRWKSRTFFKYLCNISKHVDNDEMGNASSAAEYNDVKTLPSTI